MRTSTLTELTSERFQADRMYDPTPFRSTTSRFLADPQTGIAGRYGPPPAPNATTATPPAQQRLLSLSGDRAMDPWIVIGEWAHDPNVRVRQECYYRDFWRTVVERTRSDSVEERLYLDP